MNIPSKADIKKLEEATHRAGYRDYSITKKPASTKNYRRSDLPANPYLIVKNQRSNRIIQIMWEGGLEAVQNDIIDKIEKYESKADFAKIKPY